MKESLILPLIFLSIFISGCVSAAQSYQWTTEAGEMAQKNIENLCVQECRKALYEERNLTNGPCLTNKIVSNWVCDVSHSPRQDVDNDPSNQCEAYKKGEASHFVEVDEKCNLINSR